MLLCQMIAHPLNYPINPNLALYEKDSAVMALAMTFQTPKETINMAENDNHLLLHQAFGKDDEIERAKNCLSRQSMSDL